MLKLAPSLLSADFSRLRDEVIAMQAANADWLHLDIMDNHYVPNLTFGAAICAAIRPHTTLPLDVHLMTEPVDALIAPFAEAGANIITFHPEATRHIDRTLALIKTKGCQAGLALNPATPLSVLDYTMDKLDVILIMSVNPGFAGQPFIPGTIAKIRAVREKIRAHVAHGGQDILIEVDGGVGMENIGAIRQVGADVCVAGSTTFGAGNADTGYADIIQTLRLAAQTSAT